MFKIIITLPKFLRKPALRNRKPLFSVYVPTPDINYYQNIKVVFEMLISDFFTLRSEHEMLHKVRKFKNINISQAIC